MVVFAGFFLDAQSNRHVFSRSLPYALSTVAFESCELVITSSNVVCWAFCVVAFGIPGGTVSTLHLATLAMNVQHSP